MGVCQLSLNFLVMQSLSRLSSSGVVFKLVISYRYTSNGLFLHLLLTLGIRIASVGSCSSVRRPSRFPRPFISQSGSTGPLFSHRFQSRCIRWSHWGPGGVLKAHLACCGYFITGLVHDGCCRCSVEEWPTKHRE